MRILKVAVVLILAAAGVLLVVFKTDLMTVRTWEVVPSDGFVDQGYLESEVMGKNLLLLNPGDVKAELEKDPAVKTAEVSRRFPDTLVLRLEARRPSVLVSYEDGILVIGEDGCVMGYEKAKGDRYRELLVVEGVDFKRFKVNDLLGTDAYSQLENLIVLSRFLEEARMPADCARIEAGRLVLFIHQDMRVVFGPADLPIGPKLEKFKWIYEDLQEKGINRGIIDMSFDKNPVYHPIQ